MLEEWFSDEYKNKRKSCGVPEELTFKTKNELAIEVIKKLSKKLSDSGVPHKWIGCEL